MKRIIYLPIIILTLASCQPEVSPEQAEKFIKFYGNAFMDEARDVAVLEDGSYAFCGIDSVAGEGKRAMLVVTDTYGNVKSGFPKYYSEGGYNTGANAMVVKEGGQGGFLLVGYVDVPAGDSTQRDLFLVRTTLSGRELWRKSFGSDEDEAVLHASEIFPSEGGIIPSTGFILAGYQVKNGQSDIMIMGVTDQGDSLSLGYFYPNPTVNNATANYIYNTGSAYLVVCTYDKVGTDGTDILVVSFNEELSPNIEFLGGDFDEYGRSIEHVEDNKYLVLGNRLNASGRLEILVYMIEVNGFLVTRSDLLATISEGNASLKAMRISRINGGGYAIIGTRESGGNEDIFVQFMGQDFSLGRLRNFGAAGQQRGADLDYTKDGGLLLLGTNGDEFSSMISLIRTDEEGEF